MNPRSARGAPPDGCRSRPENAEGRFPQRHFGESGPGPLWEGTGNSSVLKGSRKRFGAGLQRGRPLRVFSSSVVFGLVRIILTRRFVRCKVGIGFPVFPPDNPAGSSPFPAFPAAVPGQLPRQRDRRGLGDAQRRLHVLPDGPAVLSAQPDDLLRPGLSLV